MYQRSVFEVGRHITESSSAALRSEGPGARGRQKTSANCKTGNAEENMGKLEQKKGGGAAVRGALRPSGCSEPGTAAVWQPRGAYDKKSI